MCDVCAESGLEIGVVTRVMHDTCSYAAAGVAISVVVVSPQTLSELCVSGTLGVKCSRHCGSCDIIYLCVSLQVNIRVTMLDFIPALVAAAGSEELQEQVGRSRTYKPSQGTCAVSLLWQGLSSLIIMACVMLSREQ